MVAQNGIKEVCAIKSKYNTIQYVHVDAQCDFLDICCFAQFAFHELKNFDGKLETIRKGKCTTYQESI